MVIRIVRMTFRKDQTKAFLKIYQRSENLIRNFPGCQQVELWQDAQESNIFSTCGHWESEEALNSYRHSDLFAGIWPFVKPLFAAPAFAFSYYQASLPGKRNT